VIVYLIEGDGFITLHEQLSGRFMIQHSNDAVSKGVAESICSVGECEWSHKYRHWAIKAECVLDVLSKLEHVGGRICGDNIALFNPQKVSFSPTPFRTL
jgi:hypothetical protein